MPKIDRKGVGESLSRPISVFLREKVFPVNGFKDEPEAPLSKKFCAVTLENFQVIKKKTVQDSPTYPAYLTRKDLQFHSKTML